MLNSIDFFKKYNLWYIENENHIATSCKDAANKRKRLGSEGIPLYDELKSMAGKIKIEGKEVYIFFHCRGHAYLNFEKIRKLLNYNNEIERLSPEELFQKFDVSYGTVNPFQEDRELIQVFDDDIFNFYTSPNTLMTNAGTAKSSVEFNPKELFTVLLTINKKVIKANITQGSIQKTYTRMSIGIITGNGPDSGMFLWKLINDNINKKLSQKNIKSGDLIYPKIIVTSIPELGLSMELEKRESEVWVYLKEAVTMLCKSHIDYLMLACHTTQYFEREIQELCGEYGVIFYSIVDVVEEYIIKKDIQELTVFAIPIVASLGEYSAYKRLKKNSLDIKPMNKEVEEEIKELGYHIKTLLSEEKNEKAINKLGSLIQKGTVADNVLLALTELSVILGRFPKIQKRSHANIIDGLQLYAEKMAMIYLETLPRVDESIERNLMSNSLGLNN